VRFAFLDEGGTSTHEPDAIVGGVFVHGDRQLIPLEEKLAAVMHKHIPEKDWDSFVFHATNIWSGTKYFRNKEEWHWGRRAAILWDLASIPKELEIPIVYNRLPKQRVAERHNSAGEMSARDFEVTCHAMCFASCMLRIEDFMRLVWPTEIVQIVAEDNSEARATIRGVTNLLKNPHRLKRADIEKVDVLPLQRIRGPVQFADKNDSAPLQLADTCSFLIRRRYFRHDERSAYFYNRLKPMMLMYPSDDDKDLITRSGDLSGRFLQTWRAQPS
jgi:hypothetical protein